MDPRKLGRYEIVGELGKGAMGVVYDALDPLLERVVAIKTINLSVAEADELEAYEARFFQEAKAAGRLNHPNIVIIYDVGKSENVAYMAMEFLEGSELRQLLASGRPLAVDKAIDIAAQVADGLAYAHEHRIVHRDIKPANIMIVRDGVAKITDFGIARMRSAEVRTQTGVVLGSPKYMSPEQVMGKRADERSDIFSLGVVLYEMLTGSPPFTGDSITTVMYQTLNLIPPAPSLANPNIPEMLNYIVAKALAKGLDDRYQTATELADDLRECKKQLAQEAAKKTASSMTESTTSGMLRETLVSRDERTELFQQPASLSRRTDADESIPPPTLGISKSFDSLDATMRLAVQTGMAEDFDDYVKTQKIDLASIGVAAAPTPASVTSQPKPHLRSNQSPSAAVAEPRGWSAREKLIFAGSMILALIIGAAIVFY